MKSRMRINLAVALALILGGSGCYSFGNVSEAAGMPEVAETSEVPESARMPAAEAVGTAVSAGTEDGAAEESSLPAQAEQSGKNGPVEAETGEGTSADTESNDEEQQESQESLEGTGNPDNADASGNEEMPDSSAGTGCEGGSSESTDENGDSTVVSSKESTDENGSSETDNSGAAPDQSGSSGTDAVDIPSEGNAEESSSVPSLSQDNNADVGGSKEDSDQNASSVSDSDADTGTESKLPEEDNIDGILGEPAVEGLQGADAAANSAEEEVPVLEMPQKIHLIIDPWEIEGRGQVYSEQYVMKNNGENPIKLDLYGMACKPGEQSGVVVNTEREGIHDGDSKAIYMEMMFSNGESVIFTEEEAEYSVELKPGEELALWFAGEVNENTSQAWRDGDIKVIIMYQWDDGCQEQAENIGESAREGSDGEAVPGAEATEGMDGEAASGAEAMEGMDGEAVPDMKPVEDLGTSGKGGVDGGLEGGTAPVSDGAEEDNDGLLPEAGTAAEGGIPLKSASVEAEGGLPESMPVGVNNGLPDN